MIVRRLRVHPFGRFADREVSFAPGLTVVLGENEAGKSTLFSAIGSLLFVPATLSKPKFREKIERFIPLGGGDVARAELSFQAGGGEHLLRRTWGSTPSSELRLPDGAVIADEEAIRDRMSALLPAQPASVASVLLLRQSELAATVESLARAATVSEDLGAILRRAMLETGGVSVERFRTLAAEAAQKLGGHWDWQRDAPEGNRGFQNPWKKEVGEILRAYYELEAARVLLQNARSYEGELDDLNRRIETMASTLAAKSRFLRDNESALRDARERGKLEAELRAAKAEQVQLKQDTMDWPVSEDRLKVLAAEIEQLQARLTALARERAEVEAEERSRALRERAARIERRKVALAAAEAARAAVSGIDRGQVERIRAGAREVDRLHAGLEVSVSVGLRAKKPLGLEVSTGGGERLKLELAKGEERTLDAREGLTIDHPDLAIAVTPVADASSKAKSLAEARQKLASLLVEAGSASVEEAEERLRQVERLGLEVERAQGELAAELDGESLEGFEAKLAQLGPARGTRQAVVVAGELAGVEVSLAGLRKEERERTEKLDALRKRHGTVDRLVLGLADAVQKERRAAEGIATLSPLPPRFIDAADFVQAYETTQAEAERLKDEQNELLRERATLEGRAPEQSSEEIEGQLADAEQRYQAALARGKALRRVQEAAERLLAESDSATFDALRVEVERLFEVMTLGRYREVSMRGPTPTAVGGVRVGSVEPSAGSPAHVSAAGPSAGSPARHEMPWDYLSVGARDLLGLAVRLAMAALFVPESSGFLIMDDPLVDLDPERQAAAAQALRAFARSRQLILFTCHPSHAELLGGTRVRLE